MEEIELNGEEEMNDENTEVIDSEKTDGSAKRKKTTTNKKKKS